MRAHGAVAVRARLIACRHVLSRTSDVICTGLARVATSSLSGSRCLATSAPHLCARGHTARMRALDCLPPETAAGMAAPGTCLCVMNSASAATSSQRMQGVPSCARQAAAACLLCDSCNAAVRAPRATRTCCTRAAASAAVSTSRVGRARGLSPKQPCRCTTSATRRLPLPLLRPLPLCSQAGTMAATEGSRRARSSMHDAGVCQHGGAAVACGELRTWRAMPLDLPAAVNVARASGSALNRGAFKV